MTKVIEIVVIGGVGSGKSHVLALIDKALRDGYGPHVQVASRDLSMERSLGSPGAEPSVDTIFSLKERQPEAGTIVSRLKIDIDSSAIDSVLGKLDALGQVAEGFSVGVAGPIQSEVLQGVAVGFGLDPLESAITSAAQAACEASGVAAVILQEHLKLLCHLQREKLAE